MTTLPTSYITFEQFLADASIPEHSEWVDGTVVPIHAVAHPHERYVRWLFYLLGGYVEQSGLGEMCGDPFVMHLPASESGRQPDLFYVKTEHLGRIKNKCLEGPADLVIEVISPESRSRDLVEKLLDYERGGVPEYWIIDPADGSARFLRRDDSGRLSPVQVVNFVYRTPLWPRITFDIRWLTRDPLPKWWEIHSAWGIR